MDGSDNRPYNYVVAIFLVVLHVGCCENDDQCVLYGGTGASPDLKLTLSSSVRRQSLGEHGKWDIVRNTMWLLAA